MQATWNTTVSATLLSKRSSEEVQVRSHMLELKNQLQTCATAAAVAEAGRSAANDHADT
jgi:hypothetical protein